MSFQKCIQCGAELGAGCSHLQVKHQSRTNLSDAYIDSSGYSAPNSQYINSFLPETQSWSPARVASISDISSYSQPLFLYSQYENSDPQADWNTSDQTIDAWSREEFRPACGDTPFHDNQPTNAIIVSTTTTFSQDAHNQPHSLSSNQSVLTLTTTPQYGQTLSPVDRLIPYSAMPPTNMIPVMNDALSDDKRRRPSMTAISSIAVLPDTQDRGSALQTYPVFCSAASQPYLSQADTGDLDTSTRTPHLRPHGAPKNGSPIPNPFDNTCADSSCGDVNLCHDCFEWFLSFVDKFRRIIVSTASCNNCKRRDKCDQNISSVATIRINPCAENLERSVERMKPIPHPETASQGIPSIKSEYYCSVQDCPRRNGSGKSFSRKDNRNHHEWTVHKIPKLKRGRQARLTRVDSCTSAA